ncbi:hypothetical protein F2Q70_00016102 [Brassica cretica]|uniref:Uncharacterized protein n=1 Tax=Brassica cretica TaxID=69181 RepID=A0A8S9HY47_BRACR|nr:hypothetical protein F2Q70_00016102 [Brassica cretica]
MKHSCQQWLRKQYNRVSGRPGVYWYYMVTSGPKLVTKQAWPVFWDHRLSTLWVHRRSTFLHLLDSFLSRGRLTTLQ